MHLTDAHLDILPPSYGLTSVDPAVNMSVLFRLLTIEQYMPI